MAHEPRILTLTTRLLLPFRWDVAGVAGALYPHLEGARFREKAIWQWGDAPALYREDLLPAPAQVFFADVRSYARMDSGVLSTMVPRHAYVEIGAGAKHVRVRIRPAKSGIELFISPAGLGVLSIGLETGLEPAENCEGAAALGQGALARLYNYRLSQLQSHKSATVFGRAPSAPTEETFATVEERLGSTGEGVTPGELAEMLLPRSVEPCQAARGQSSLLAGGQFNIFTVACLPADAPSLQDHPQRGAVLSLLLDLAQVHEPKHSGNDTEDTAVPVARLNRHHWSASSTLGTAHLVMDQQGDVEWNQQRNHQSSLKYFIPMLLAHYQRRQAEYFMRRAHVEVTERHRGAEPQGLLSLYREVLDFGASGCFPIVSFRHALNNCYELCLRGERAELAMARMRELLAGLDAIAARATQQVTVNELDRNVRTIAAVQQSVEWVEVFLVGVYAAHLTDMMMHVAKWELDHGTVENIFTAASIPGVSLLAGLVAFTSLRPHQSGKHAPGTGHGRLLLGLVLLFMVWGLLGILVFSRAPS